MKRKIKKSIAFLSIVLIIFSQLYFTESISAKEKEDFVDTIERIVQWKKQAFDIDHNESLLTNEFLQQAGDTTGDWFPVGLGRVGYNDEYDNYLAVIEEVVTERYKEDDLLSESKATEWHRISLAILSMGGDPTSIGKDKNENPINLIADGTYNREKEAPIGEQGINGWVWALITVDSMRYKIPDNAETDREEMIIAILEDQLEDGGFALHGNEIDPDMTGMVITALAPYYNSEETFSYKQKSTGENVTRTVREVVDEALEMLSKIQLTSGGFASMDMENTESIVQVIVALTSLGIDIFEDERFIKNGNSMYDALMSFQMQDGGFTHSNEYDEDNPTAKPGESNPMATDQAFYSIVALERFQQGYRSLYDFRPEMTDEVKKKIEEVEEAIESLGKDEEAIVETFHQYKEIPIDERSYVANYYMLADKMEQYGIDNDSEYVSEFIGVNEQGNGTVSPIYTDEITEDALTKEDVENIDDLIGANSTKHEVEIITLLKKLNEADENYEKEIALLEDEKLKIEEIQTEIDAINETIVEELFPLEKINVNDEAIVKDIIQRYEDLDNYDQEKIVNYEDVEKAMAQISSMKRNKKLAIVGTVVLISFISLLFYRKRQRKIKKQEDSYLND